MLVMDFLQSKESESVISLDFPILIMPCTMPSIVDTFPLRYFREAIYQIDPI